MADDRSSPFRPISQILQIAILPEIRSRVANGSLSRDNLTLELLRFRWGQHGGQAVELNEEFELKVVANVNRPMQAGDHSLEIKGGKPIKTLGIW